MAHTNAIDTRHREASNMKPRVYIIRAQGKPLIVWRAGEYFVASFTWHRLAQKVMAGQFKRVADTTLAVRLPAIKRTTA